MRLHYKIHEITVSLLELTSFPVGIQGIVSPIYGHCGNSSKNIFACKANWEL